MTVPCLSCGAIRAIKRSYVLSGKYKYCNHRCRKEGLANRGENSGRAKLTWKDIMTIRDSYEPYKTTQKQIALLYGVSSRQIWEILKGKQWSLR